MNNLFDEVRYDFLFFGQIAAVTRMTSMHCDSTVKHCCGDCNAVGRERQNGNVRFCVAC